MKVTTIIGISVLVLSQGALAVPGMSRRYVDVSTDFKLTCPMPPGVKGLTGNENLGWQSSACPGLDGVNCQERCSCDTKGNMKCKGYDECPSSRLQAACEAGAADDRPVSADGKPGTTIWSCWCQNTTGDRFD
ncbi:hypothetical protein EDD36DRAFT_413562 [Exophiala viscosa]|uniref:Cyanovirin-N domain-containing protein n=1 Tax=Exophiala viscosa TaxID=2486360 RepID=A0AAN6E4C4_9EURO|nr:hypothetical protein EDD36DRAFT_413562 [Exophiala viscosa]